MKIALFGKMRSGKDTVADILVNEYNFTKISFGEGIRKIIEEFFPESLSKGKPRHHYQFIGQELRKLNKDVWINNMLKRAENIRIQNLIYTGNSTDFVVADGRQLNEAERLREEGYTIILVVADEITRIERMEKLNDDYTLDMLRHETEQQVDLIEPDYVLLNTDSVDGLKRRIKDILHELR